MPTWATVEQDDIRVRIELERNPMPAGKITRVTTTVRNLGTTTLHWMSDGCATPVYVRGEAAMSWRNGDPHEGQSQVYKDRVMDWAYATSPHPGPIISFRPEKWLGGGDYGCADLGIIHHVPPGDVIRDTRAWDGLAYLRWGPFPSGPVTITGTFGGYWRGKHEPEYRDMPRIVVSLDAWVTGGADESWLSPPEVVDAALADPAFVAYLETQRLGWGRDEILWYRPGMGVWEVGVLVWYEAPEPRLHLVLVDPHSGEVLDTVDRRWSRKRDGSP